MPTIVQIDAWDPVAGAVVALCAASHDHPEICHLGGGTWWPTIAKLPSLRYDLFDGAFAGQIVAPSSTIALQTEPWPNFGRYILADAKIRLWHGSFGDAATAYVLRFDGRVSSQPKLQDGRAEIDFAVDDRWLDTALLALYAGTGGIEGVAALKGQAKPLALGAPRYVPGKLVDSVNSVFQVSAYGAVQEFEAALEKLARFPAPIGDYPDYASLVAAQIPAGKWATARAVGMARFGAPPTGQISFLLKGDAAGTDGWARTPGKLIRRLAILSGGAGKLDDASLNALDVARPYNASIYVEAQTTARELIQKLAASINAVAGVSWTGQLFVAPVAVGATTIVLAADGTSLPPVASVQQIDAASPYQKLAIGAERAWAVHELGDIAFTATVVDLGLYASATTYREGNVVNLADGSRWLFVAASPAANSAPAQGNANWSRLTGPTAAVYGDGTSIEVLKPAQAGADRTSANTAVAIAGQGPGATASADQVLNNSTEGVVRIARPVGGGYGTQTSQVSGALKVRLPVSWTATMMRMRIEVYEYSTGATSTYTVSGYNYPGSSPSEAQWISTAAQMVGPDSRRRTVRFGHDGTKCAIWIGEAGDTWSYPQVRVLDFFAGFNPVTEATWASGWTVTFDTGGGQNVTSTIATPNAGESVFGVNMLEQRGGILATLASFKTLLGIAAGFTGQGSLATLSSLANGSPYLTGFGYLSATDRIILGTQGPGGITNNANTQWLTDLALITSLGQAASFAGQGPGATASADQVLNNSTEGVVRIARPVGGGYGTQASQVSGALKVRLPVSWTATMMRMRIEVYEYSTGATSTYTVSGYNYSGDSNNGQWINTAAQMVGPDNRRRTVRFGHDGTKCAIWIGEAGDTWSYPQVRVLDFFAGFNPINEATWASGWTVTFDTGGGQNVTSTIATPNAGESVFGVNMLEQRGGALATLAAFKTLLGISSGFTGQGALATKGSVNLASDEVTNRFASNLFYGNSPGTTIEALKPGEGGANVTEYRTAASIAGQGPGATAIGEKVLNNYAGNGVLRIARPIGGSLGAGSTVNGALKIRLPQSWTSTMIRFEVEIYEYGSNASATYTVGGYNHSSQQWLNTTAQMVGPDAYRRPVSFGHDGQTCCIWIGNDQSTWQYPQIGIKNFVAGFATYNESYWDTGWALSFGGAPQNVSSLVSSPNSGEARYGVNVLEGAGVPATLGNFKTSQGTAAGFIGQGPFATAPQLNSGNVFSGYFAQNAFSLGYTITRSDGTSIVTESLAITSYGIAAGFTGQAALATKNTVGANDSDMGLTGQAAVYSNDNRQTFNSTDYQACASVTLTPQQGQPVKGRFTAILTDISGTSTQQYIRIRRDDGTVVKYGSGLLVAARDEGETCAIDFIDSVSAGRQTTWYVEVAKKAGANHAIAVDGAFLHVEETSRNQYQNVTIIAPSGTGAGAGSGGGGNVNGTGGGFGCPEVDEPFLLANADGTGPGQTIPAGQVRAGMFAWTRHERTGEWGAFRVSYTCIKSDEIWRAPDLPRTSPSHQFINEDLSITEMRELGTFERMGEVVAFHVDDARTYIVGAARAWSHNKQAASA